LQFSFQQNRIFLKDPYIFLNRFFVKNKKKINFNISENNIRSIQAAQVAGYRVQAYSIDERAVITVMEQSFSRNSSSSSSNPKGPVSSCMSAAQASSSSSSSFLFFLPC
jgi:hypothetical protein